MGRLEVSCRRFAILSGVEQEPQDYAICVHPGAPGIQRKGTLALITEAAGSHPSLAVEACKLVQREVVGSYFADNALSLTSSLLNALDHANAALLRYNYTSHEAPASTGAQDDLAAYNTSGRSSRAKVGATAILIRPDGAGVYLSQMAPTQAYVLHSNLLSAIPEPSSWKEAAQHSLAVLSGAQSAGGTGLDTEEEVDPLPNTTLPSPSLGSGPGVEADLVYRRVEAGDMVVLVSTSLARYLDRERAERIFSRYDADGVINALRGIATENGLAEAHACVLELGVLDSSGVERDFEPPARAVQTQQMEENETVAPASRVPQLPAMPNFKEVLRAPREWLQRRKLDPELAVEQSPQGPGVPAIEATVAPELTAVEPQHEPVLEELAANDEDSADTQGDATDDEDANDDEDGKYFWSKQPTQLFPRRPIELPPYRTIQHGNNAVSPELFEEVSSEAEQTAFDGWEDAPPALDDPRYDATHRILFKPKLFPAWPEDDEDNNEDVASANGQPLFATSAPHLWDVEQDDVSGHAFAGSAGMPVAPRFDVRGLPKMGNMANAAGDWLLTTTRSLLPGQVSGGALSARGFKASRTIPLRMVIAVALLIAGLIFIFSVMSMAGNGQKAATRNLLQEAQQMDTLANQPGLLAADRLEKLQLALAQAQQAVAASPDSSDAKLLATKIETEIDQAQGITRFASVKLLFDLDAIDKAGQSTTTSTTTSASTSAAAPQNPVSGTASLSASDIIVQSDSAYVLDRAAGKLYKCQIAARACSALLQKGQTQGEKQVGTLVGMSMRIDTLVAIDDNLVSYTLNPDTGAWQAQTLGNSDALVAPKDVATFDGNLYLLEAKSGQISKYVSGQYDQAPLDWIQDQATIDAMKAPVALAVDGDIYVALADGAILTMEGGKLSQTIAPKATSGASAPTALFTNTDVKDLYLLRAGDGTITHLSKDGNTIATLKAPAGTGLDKLSGMTVDEAKGTYYLVEGHKVFAATLAPSTAPTPAANATSTGPASQVAPPPGPAARPTVAP